MHKWFYRERWSTAFPLIAELHTRPWRSPENLVITWPYTDRPNDCSSAPEGNQCLISHLLTSLGAQVQTDFVHPFCDQLTAVSKQCICWPVSPDRIAGSGVDPSRSGVLKLSADKLLLILKWSQAQVYFFKKLMWNMLCLCHWPRIGGENSASYWTNSMSTR